ncbi:MAG TPA: hypothetical protein PK725_13350 [Rhodocyclaceae bacterium]|nr:hypothetical protein [Rhodocyclaceae bacterium]
MFDNKQEVITPENKLAAMARVLVEAKGKLLRLPNGDEAPELIWSGFVTGVTTNYSGKTQVSLLGMSSVPTSLSVDEVAALLQTGE